MISWVEGKKTAEGAKLTNWRQDSMCVEVPRTLRKARELEVIKLVGYEAKMVKGFARAGHG